MLIIFDSSNNLSHSSCSAILAATFTITCLYLSSEHSAERTLIIIKPDGVERGLATEIINIMRNEFNIKLVMGRFTYANIEQTKEHYIDHANTPFYKRITEGLCSEIYTMIWEGDNCVSQLRL